MKCLALLALVALIPTLAAAEVDPKNGNYVLTYEDLSLKAQGKDLSVRRTFNSAAVRSLGWFGWGWSSEYETRLYPMPDGSIVVWENGSGPMHFYDPAAGGKRHEAGLDAIVAAARRKDHLDAKQVAALRADLDMDEEARARAAIRLRVKGAAKTAKPGDRWVSRLCGELVREQQHWRRSGCPNEPSTDEFSLSSGVLLRSSNSQRAITLDWSGAYLAFVTESGGLALQYHWTPTGRLARITAISGEELRYTYSPQGELIRVEGRTIPGERIDFTYDVHHRLTRSTYVDTTTLKAAYDARGLVTSTIDRQNVKTTYTYGGSGRAYWTQLQRFSAAGELEAERKFDYDIAPSPTGEHAVERMVVREGEFEITVERDGRISIGGPAVERRQRVEQAARTDEDVQREPAAEAERLQEASIRKFSTCANDAAQLETETSMAERRSVEAFNQRCEDLSGLQLSHETTSQICSHPALRSRWCGQLLTLPTRP